MAGSLQIRRIRPTDLEPFRQLRLRSLSMDPMAFYDTYEKASQGPISNWIDWINRASSSNDAISFLAEADGARLVGHVGSSWTDGVTGIGAMWVEPEFRGRGLGARLLDTVLQWAMSTHPSSDVRLAVVPTQEVAVRLYKSRGFQETGKISPLDHTPGAVYHEMLLRRKSPPG